MVVVRSLLWQNDGEGANLIITGLRFLCENFVKCWNSWFFFFFFDIPTQSGSTTNRCALKLLSPSWPEMGICRRTYPTVDQNVFLRPAKISSEDKIPFCGCSPPFRLLSNRIGKFLYFDTGDVLPIPFEYVVFLTVTIVKVNAMRSSESMILMSFLSGPISLVIHFDWDRRSYWLWNKQFDTITVEEDRKAAFFAWSSWCSLVSPTKILMARNLSSLAKIVHYRCIVYEIFGENMKFASKLWDRWEFLLGAPGAPLVIVPPLPNRLGQATSGNKNKNPSNRTSFYTHTKNNHLCFHAKHQELAICLHDDYHEHEWPYLLGFFSRTSSTASNGMDDRET